MPSQVTLSKIAVVMLGAALGGAARYLLATLIAERIGGRFPWGTFTVNITGCFLIGLISTIIAGRTDDPVLWRLFLVTGILGGYTTFSAFGWETMQLSREGDIFMAFANALGSVIAGCAAVWLGILFARH